MIGTVFLSSILCFSCDPDTVKFFFAEEKVNIFRIQQSLMHHVLTHLGRISFSRFCGDSCNKIRKVSVTVSRLEKKRSL